MAESRAEGQDNGNTETDRIQKFMDSLPKDIGNKARMFYFMIERVSMSLSPFRARSELTLHRRVKHIDSVTSFHVEINASRFFTMLLYQTTHASKHCSSSVALSSSSKASAISTKLLLFTMKSKRGEEKYLAFKNSDRKIFARAPLLKQRGHAI
jgi:hypothetical protein